MSEEEEMKTRRRKGLFQKIDSVIDKLIQAQKLEENSQELAATELIKEVIADCKEIVASIELLSENGK